MHRQLLVLDSKHRSNPEEKEGSIYKFKLNRKVRLNGMIRLEQFIFQNSQYVFSKEKKTNMFIYTDSGASKNITFEGKFDNVDSFVKRFNEVMQANQLNIRMIYTAYLYEIKIQHLQGEIFSLEEFGNEGKFFDLIGYNKINQGANVYTNINVPKLFSQNLIYISFPEIGMHSTTTKDSKPYTFLVLSQPGFEIVSNINNTFSNEFYIKDKELDEITVKISDSDGLPFVNNKGNANFIIVLSY